MLDRAALVDPTVDHQLAIDPQPQAVVIGRVKGIGLVPFALKLTDPTHAEMIGIHQRREVESVVGGTGQPRKRNLRIHIRPHCRAHEWRGGKMIAVIQSEQTTASANDLIGHIDDMQRRIRAEH